MSDKPPHSLIRRLYVVLGIFIISTLLYQNFTLYSITKNLKRSQSKTLNPDADLPESSEISMALTSLVAENLTYRASLKRQGTNLKECLSKLPKNEVDDFYRRHREELQQERLK